jgi:hypothetical protein
LKSISAERTQPAPYPVPRYLALKSRLLIAVLAAAAGVGLRLAKPVAPPDPAFLERLEGWKAHAAEFERAHHLQGPPPSP